MCPPDPTAAPVPSVAPPSQLEVDEETDSTFGDDDNGSTTTSLADSIFAFRMEHGRSYHAYKDGQYFIPNDSKESDRLDLQHHLFSLTFDNKLFFAPIREDPKHALDIGTGTGIWAIDFADEYPGCEVIGTDLSPNQPSFVPPNLRFLIDDAEDDWIYSNKFDLIHMRLMGGSFANWKKVLKSAYDNLAPGGYLEIQDYVLPVKSNDGTTVGTDLEKWCYLMIEGAGIFNRPMDAAKEFKGWMEEIGFADVEELTFVWPTNPWPRTKRMKEIGKWSEVNLSEGAESFALALLTRALGWKKEEVEVFCAKVRNDLKNRYIHGYFEIPVIYGRKPE